MYTREQIVDAIESCLDESERKIIKARFGLEDGLTMTLDDIVLRFGAGREQVREIEKKVLTHLKVH